MYGTGEYGCGCHYYHGHHPHGYGGSHHESCCGHGHRRFYTKEEIITHLEEYLQQLQAEVKGVEEHINRLKKAEA